MTRQEIFDKIDDERSYQDSTWGKQFDAMNTANDWATYMNQYVAKATVIDGKKDDGSPNFKFNMEQFKTNILKAVTIGIACLETIEENQGLPPRHYDE